MGYVAFTLDMYIAENTTDHPQEAGIWTRNIIAHVEQWQRCAQAGLDVLRWQKQVDPKRIAAIVYCFAGATVLQLAYSGEVHIFTNPEANDRGMQGPAYNAKADQRSWQDMKIFFDEIFGQ